MALPKNGGASSATSGIGVGEAFYAQMLAVADTLLTEYGMACNLRNNKTKVLRPCIAAVIKYNPRDAATLLANPTMRTVLIAAGLGDIPNKAPDWENEQLITYQQPPANPPVVNEILSFTQPLELYAPGGIVVLYQTNVKL